MKKWQSGKAKNWTLGGKSACIVLDDADIDSAVRIAIEGMFYNQGEACTSTSRLLVHESRYAEFSENFKAAAAALVVGDPLAPGTDLGPMVDGKQQAQVQRYAGRILGEVTPDMTVAQEEIFGPVACLMKFTDDDEAVEIANGTSYGLTAAICTTDETRAARLAERLEVGMVFVNNYAGRTFIGSPFGGVKGSGYGREYAEETLREFVRAKDVRFPSGRGIMPGWPPRG